MKRLGFILRVSEKIGTQNKLEIILIIIKDTKMDYTSYKIVRASQNEMIQEAHRARNAELAKQKEEKVEIIPAARPARHTSFIMRLFGRARKISI